MTSLNPIGLFPAIAAFEAPPISGTASSIAGLNANSEGSFLSAMQTSSSGFSMDFDTDSAGAPSFAPAGQSLLQKDADQQNALLLSWNTQPVAATDNLPLPVNLSLNMFGPKSGQPESEENNTRPAQAKQNDNASSAGQPNNALPWAVPVPNSLPATATAARTAAPEAPKAGRAVDPDTRTSQNHPHIEVEANPATAAPASQLAFALRLKPAGEQTDAPPPVGQVSKAPDSAGPAVTNIAAAQSQGASSGSADSNTDDGHPANRQNDAGLDSDPVTPLPAGLSDFSSQATNFAGAPPSPSSPAQASTAEPAQAPQTAAQTRATADADAPAKTGTASELSFTVSAGDQQKVEVRLMDRAGEVRVSVRTPNEELASTLRGDLGSLTGKLNQSGYATEAFTPASHAGEFSREQSSATPDQQQGGGQDKNADRQGQQQDSQQDGRGKRPAWLDELENSMANAPIRKESR